MRTGWAGDFFYYCTTTLVFLSRSFFYYYSSSLFRCASTFFILWYCLISTNQPNIMYYLFPSSLCYISLRFSHPLKLNTILHIPTFIVYVLPNEPKMLALALSYSVQCVCQCLLLVSHTNTEIDTWLLPVSLSHIGWIEIDLNSPPSARRRLILWCVPCSQRIAYRKPWAYNHHHLLHKT